jgi:hypothetical protein
METLGIVIAGLGLLLALAGSGWTIVLMCRQSRLWALLPIGVTFLFPTAVGIAWDWHAAPWAGLGLVLVSFLIPLSLLPILLSWRGWQLGMSRWSYVLNAAGVAVFILGALITTQAAK